MRTIAQKTAPKRPGLVGGGGVDQYVVLVLVNGECMQSSTHFLQDCASVVKITVSHKEQTPPERILVLF